MMRWTAGLALMLTISPLGGCAAGGAFIRGDEGPSISRGHALALSRCADCHGIGRDKLSPHADAPPFRTLVNRYSPDSLRFNLELNSMVGHFDMPRMRTEASERADLVAYIFSLDP